MFLNQHQFRILHISHLKSELFQKTQHFQNDWKSFGQPRISQRQGRQQGVCSGQEMRYRQKKWGAWLHNSLIFPRTQKTLKKSIYNKNILFSCVGSLFLVMSLSCYTTTPSHGFSFSRISDQLIPTPRLFVPLCSLVLFLYSGQSGIWRESWSVWSAASSQLSSRRLFCPGRVFPLKKWVFLSILFSPVHELDVHKLQWTKSTCPVQYQRLVPVNPG